MNLKVKILLLIITTTFFACSPQIRFASKQDLKNSYSSTTKTQKNSNNDSEIISEVLKKMNNAIKNHDDDNALLKIQTKFRIDLIQNAKKLIGTPYCFGGQNSNCTDCSGFVKKVYESIGLILPRTAAEQYNFGIEINDNDLQPGDLVFFIRNNKIGHVGIYLDNNKFIHASSNKGVTISDLNESYYKTTYAGARRIFRPM